MDILKMKMVAEHEAALKTERKKQSKEIITIQNNWENKLNEIIKNLNDKFAKEIANNNKEHSENINAIKKDAREQLERENNLIKRLTEMNMIADHKEKLNQ